MLLKSTKVLSANIKSINPMQKYPHIIELRNFDAFIFSQFFNFFWNLFNTKTIEIYDFSFSTK